ncbi:MAG: type I-U CRISPR-associated protein Cas5/Cas6 [Verrucomicrobia bacterium]|nr:type I-U CRISPR-associated protein Cas5/Cas6 [Verrucomicrobiota bacterium]MCG2679250.1 type I-U CRISPR-associated protein Csb2 [Kiritimatiellia bacterium]MBU4248644.1 type I-U CRISPR-associated protein Cas5/Cas6 [Verrucomicrobiota bacterium]MBU4290105.1 type I-U CRISPR-associated protein Cas5/Cas6 [Verrucomicrobiota bacterium]MBU4430469.1 type I-U CRISPR-associated protein Cas5/Cas6 [Verrucomicrobiota bacterium]
MIRYLLLSIRFLDDRYHGLTDNGEKAEWPPSPFRVFQALIAGNARGQELSESFRNALFWLERRVPPVIIAPDARKGRELLTYVLNNVSDSDPNSRTPKAIRPTLLNGDQLVQYAWTFEDAANGAMEHAKTVANAARHIRCLGWGIDLAIGCGEISATFPTVIAPRVLYRPCQVVSASGLDLRTPKEGSLISLENSYADFLKRYELPGVTRLESAGAIYEPQRYVTGVSRPNVAFRLVNAAGDTVPIRHQLIAPLVGMIRNLANRPRVIESLSQDVIDREIKGHPKGGSTKRVSILPLPTIRNGPTDGRIRRVMLAQPFESDGVLCCQLAQLFDGQELTPLPNEERFPPIYLERLEERDKVLSCYTGISRVWASVTPVLLPGYDDRNQNRGDQQKRLARAEQLACKALAQAGIETSAQVELSRVPFWAGSLHARDYCPRDKLCHYPRYHVRLSFDQAVTGPLAIGAGRHAGFGVLAAVEPCKTKPTSS